MKTKWKVKLGWYEKLFIVGSCWLLYETRWNRVGIWKKELGKFLRSKFPHIDFKFVFVNNFTLKSILSHKEKLPSELVSGLVYLYSCGTCGATYIGQSKQCLRTRVGSHFEISARTGNLLFRPVQSAVRDHIEECGSQRTLKSFKVVRSFENSTLLRIFESLEIYFRKPSLNQDGSSHPLVFV